MLIYLIFIILITFFVFKYIENYGVSHKEYFKNKKSILFTRCKDYGVGEIMEKLFDNYKIKKDKCEIDDDTCDNKWDIYLPCGYNNIEYELRNIYPNNKEQIIFGISGCDSIVSKNNIWKLLHSKYGRKKASSLMPNTYIIDNESDMKLFRNDFNPKKNIF